MTRLVPPPLLYPLPPYRILDLSRVVYLVGHIDYWTH